MQGLSVRVARAANDELGRKGRVFADRYHARALTTPRAVRFALRYVLLNARKHDGRGVRADERRGTRVDEGRGVRAVPFGFVDTCSSGAWFDGFARPGGLVFGAAECRSNFARDRLAEDAPVVAARTWLLRVGYRRAGAFDVDDAPAGTGVVG
jgi:hypothetical protein